MHIEDLIEMFSAVYAGAVIALCILFRIWIKAKIVFEDIKDPNIIAAKFYVGDIYETQVRKDAFKSFSSILNTTFALIIANRSKQTKILLWQVKKLEKVVAIAFIIALLLAAFGFMCALNITLPPGYNLPQ